MPRQPKLRASCDRCGASKLKCDRGQPECERCISHGIPCVYGVSRKMGKPRRYRQQAQPGAATTRDGPDRRTTDSRTAGSTLNTGVAAGAGSDAASDTSTRSSSSSGSGGSGSGGSGSTAGAASTTADTVHNTSIADAAPWDMDVDHMSLDVLADLYGRDGNHHPQDPLIDHHHESQHEQTQSELPTSFPALDFINWASIADHARADGDVPLPASALFFDEPASGTPEILESPGVRGHSLSNTPTQQPAATPHQLSEITWQPPPPPPTAATSSSSSSSSSCSSSSSSSTATITAATNTSGGMHDCAPEAYEILKMLSSLDCHLQNDGGDGGGGPSPLCGLDHMLRLNRKATEQLERLLACPCARSPHLSLLYVSVISRILSWYQQAAGGAGDAQPSWSPVKEEGDASSSALPRGHHAAPTTTTPSSSSVLSSPAEVSSSASAGGALRPGPMAVVAAPVKVAVGTFDVDDLGIQKAVKIQLLSGELRRAGRLIDKLAAQYTAAGGSGPRHPGGSAAAAAMYVGAHTSSLHHSLDAWLRGEHARITNLMRLRLKELNT